MQKEGRSNRVSQLIDSDPGDLEFIPASGPNVTVHTLQARLEELIPNLNTDLAHMLGKIEQRKFKVTTFYFASITLWSSCYFVLTDIYKAGKF